MRTQGCGRTGFDCDGSWYRLSVTGGDDTTVWYCSPYCLIMDAERFARGCGRRDRRTLFP